MLLAFIILLPIIWIILASFTESTHAAYVVERIFRPDFIRTDIKGNKLDVKYQIIHLGMQGSKTFEFGPEYAGKHVEVRVTEQETKNEEGGFSQFQQILDYKVYDKKPDIWLVNFQLGGIGQVPDEDESILKNKSEGANLRIQIYKVDIQTDTGVEKANAIKVSFRSGDSTVEQNFVFGPEYKNKQVLLSFNESTKKIETFFADKEFRPEFGILSFDLDQASNIKRPVKVNNQLLVTYLNVLTIKNYREIIFDLNFRNWLTNSLLVSIATALISVLLGFFAGYSFSRFKFPGRQISMLWVIATQLFPLAMMIVPFYILAAGILPLAIPGFSIVNTRWGLVLIYSATALPFSIWMLKGYFDTIPTDLEEAAAIDGASLGQLLALILFPLARPAMFTAFLFAFVQSWNEYAISSMFMTKVEMLTLPVGLQTLMGGSGSFNQNIAWFAAGAIIVSIPIVLLFLSMKKELVESSTLGAVKG